MNYIPVTESVCDLDQKLCDRLGLTVIPMEFNVDNVSYLHYPDCREMPLDVFYKKLKEGADAHTTQINIESYTRFFSDIFERGLDILYICFTSGLCGSYNTCRIAAEDLKEKYPQRRLEIIDCACASVGQGNLVYHVGKYVQENSPTIDEAKQYTEDLKMRVCHWFVVEDFDQLKKGGRVSSVTATFGKALNIKPLLTVDDDGKLMTVAKIRGYLKAFDALTERLHAYGEDLENQTVVIGHTACPERAEKLRELVAPFVKDSIVTEIGPVIGTHVGAGMLALTFHGKRIYK